MSELIVRLKALRHRYLTRLLAHAAIVAALGATCAVALGWKLLFWKVHPSWLIGGAVISGAVIAGTTWWMLRRRWVGPQGVARQLDQALGLEQRLVTVMEFAQASPPPSLYPVLVRDTETRLRSSTPRLPRLLDRTTGVLLIVLIALLLVPRTSTTASQLATSTRPPEPPPSSPQPSPPPPPRSDQPSPTSELDRPFDAPRQKAGLAQGRPESFDKSSGLSPEQSRRAERGEAESKDDTGGATDSARGDSQDPQGSGTSPAASAQSSGGMSPSMTQPSAAGGAQPPAEAPSQAGSLSDRPSPDRQDEGTIAHQPRDARKPGEPQPSTVESSQRDAEPREASGRTQPTSSDARTDARTQAMGHGSASPSGSASQQREGTRGGDDGTSPQRAQGAQQGRGTSAGNEALTMGEIRQLLNDLSGELQALQVQLGNPQPDGSQTEAGRGTDPTLYESPESWKQSGRPTVPIQLETDLAPSSASRPAGGTGSPSGELLDLSPRQPIDESSTLSEQPTEEISARRTVVPPEYRPVFERLYQRDDESP